MTAMALLYTAEEVAKSLHIGRDKVYQLIASGDLKSVKIGGSRRITREALDHFVAGLNENVA
jgi:excisionase family DNA binding protein